MIFSKVLQDRLNVYFDNENYNHIWSNYPVLLKGTLKVQLHIDISVKESLY